MFVKGLPRDNLYGENDDHNDEAASDQGMPDERKQGVV